MRFRRRAPPSGTRKAQDTPSKGIFSKGSNGQDERISEIIMKRLSSGNPNTVIMGINGLMVRNPRTQELKYQKKEICKKLVWLIGSSEEKDVKNTAAKILTKLLAEYNRGNGSDAAEIIGAGITEKSPWHLRLWTKIIGEKKVPAKVKECAVGKLSEYSGEELIGKVDGIEMLLLERMMDADESKGTKDMIEQLFGPGRKERPMIGVQKEMPEDMTMQIETVRGSGNPNDRTVRIETGSAPHPAGALGKQEATQDIDAIGLQIYLLRQENPKKRKEGAKNLYDSAMKSKNPNTVRRILDALRERGGEFADECKDVAKKLEIVSADSRNRATLPPGPR